MAIEWTAATPFQALALTGGGYRGLFTAKALQVMEDQTKAPIGRSFDLLCGTSIGGIVALAGAFEVPMERVVRTFEEHGELIFPPRRTPSTAIGKLWDMVSYARRPRYQSGRLRDVIAKLIPRESVLGDALHAVAIPAVNLTTGKPQVFKTRHVAEWTRDWKLKVTDVALATAAAPTFFELAEVSGQLYADGGLFANAPDLIAIHEAEHFLGVKKDAMRVLSVGTTTKKYSVSFGAGRNFGILDWMSNERLLSVIISSQQQFVEQVASHRLGDSYLRIDCEPSNEQVVDLGLDVANETARKALMALAEKAVTDILGTRLRNYLSHRPQLRLHKEAYGTCGTPV